MYAHYLQWILLNLQQELLLNNVKIMDISLINLIMYGTTNGHTNKIYI